MSPSVADAARAMAAGALVVYPTDTLLGLGAKATDRPAVERLLAAKGRPPRQPLSVAVSSFEELEPLADLSPAGRRFVRAHLPGPFTILARPSSWARRSLAPAVAGGRTVGLRVPDHPVARELARRVGPVIATSANRHGSPPARTVADARAVFGGAVSVYLSGRPPPSGRPSELVDLTGRVPRRLPRRR
ncbi:MAG TPA: L-threonylcarbamoyladenylate synthase [Thermoplasmata archaeon]|nr:L-threonylcarbamoyladenylate synthase [Thermoplasmata archaeon]